MDREIYVNSVYFGILCNFSPICGEKRAKEAASFVRDLYNENKRMLALAEEAETRAKKAERERDVAVNLLKRVNDETGNCYGCKYFDIDRRACTDNVKKSVCDCGENNLWKWCGTKEE